MNYSSMWKETVNWSCDCTPFKCILLGLAVYFCTLLQEASSAFIFPPSASTDNSDCSQSALLGADAATNFLPVGKLIPGDAQDWNEQGSCIVVCKVSFTDG